MNLSRSNLNHPTAFLPIAMSLAAIATLVIHIALFGAGRQADEGTAAHIWQLLMAGQVPIILFYLAKWVPRDSRAALRVFALQMGAALTALAPVYLLGL